MEKLLDSLALETGLLGAQAEYDPTPVALALRGEARGLFTFEVNGTVIVLDIQSSSEGKVHILGQVAADDQDQWTGARVEIRQGNELQCSTTVDDLGAFRCEGIMSGQQELRIVPTGGSPVVVTNLEF